MSNKTRARLDLTARLVIVLWAVTFAHHLYGGLRFDSPGRIGAAVAFTAILGLTLWLWRLGGSWTWARRTYLATVVGFWVVLLGLYEGGYNHALYVVLRWLAPGLADRAYATDSDALLSSDVFFQGTGVLTLVAALAVAATLPQALRASRATDAPPHPAEVSEVRGGDRVTNHHA